VEIQRNGYLAHPNFFFLSMLTDDRKHISIQELASSASYITSKVWTIWTLHILCSKNKLHSKRLHRSQWLSEHSNLRTTNSRKHWSSRKAGIPPNNVKLQHQRTISFCYIDLLMNELLDLTLIQYERNVINVTVYLIHCNWDIIELFQCNY